MAAPLGNPPQYQPPPLVGPDVPFQPMGQQHSYSIEAQQPAPLLDQSFSIEPATPSKAQAARQPKRLDIAVRSIGLAFTVVGFVLASPLIGIHMLGYRIGYGSHYYAKEATRLEFLELISPITDQIQNIGHAKAGTTWQEVQYEDILLQKAGIGREEYEQRLSYEQTGVVPYNVPQNESLEDRIARYARRAAEEREAQERAAAEQRLVQQGGGVPQPLPPQDEL